MGRTIKITLSKNICQEDHLYQTISNKNLTFQHISIIVIFGMKKAYKLTKSTGNPIGRPTVITPKTLARLKSAFRLGATDAIACSYAKIHQSTFYYKMQHDPDFFDEIQSYKHLIRHDAIKKITATIKDKESGTSDAWRWLERKYPNEFSPAPSTLMQVNSSTNNNYIEFNETPVEDTKE